MASWFSGSQSHEEPSQLGALMRASQQEAGRVGMSPSPHGTLPLLAPSTPDLAGLEAVGTEWRGSVSEAARLGEAGSCRGAPRALSGSRWNPAVSHGESISCFIAETSFEGSETKAS